MITGLSLENLALSRGDRPLFAGLGLAVAPGEAVALTGANGAGKTSLLRAIAGLIRPDAGTVRFVGADGPVASEDARAQALHLIGHQDGLKTGRAAWDELLFQVLWTGGTQASARAAAARLKLERLLGLEVRKLSAGQRRRVALARLIASPRPLWLLDEPLAPLDAEQRAVFGDLMQGHLDAGGLVIAAVHDPLPITARTVEIGA
jgi:heme exporter protein A